MKFLGVRARRGAARETQRVPVPRSWVTPDALLRAGHFEPMPAFCGRCEEEDSARFHPQSWALESLEAIVEK